METIESIILASHFWEGLAPEFVPIVAETASLSRYGVGELIFRERQEAEELQIVHRGKVAIETFVPGRGVVVLRMLGPGDALGWAWLIAPYRWQYSARSVDTTEIISFRASALRRKAELNPAFGKDLVTRTAQVLLQELDATRQKLREFRDTEVGRRIDECLGEAGADDEIPPNADKPS